MTPSEYALLAFSSLFAIVDPIAAVPAFIAMTPNDPRSTKLRTARLACVVAAGVLVLFALAGKWIFRIMGITMPAFQIAASILLLRIALDMLYGRRSQAHETREEVAAGAEKDEIAISPLAVPMLAGPGAISTSLILLSQAQNWIQQLLLFACIGAVCLTTYGILRLAIVGAGRLNPLALKLVTRLMGLLVAAVSIQFILNAIEQTNLLKR